MRPNNNRAFNRESFEHGLNDWVAQAPVDERANREVAKNRILAWQRSLGIGTTLDLSNLSLTSIPSGIGHLDSLMDLNLDNNRLREIPNEIATLRMLNNLSLSNNQFDTFPDVIARLRNLENLDLRRNRLTTIPDSIITGRRIEERRGILGMIINPIARFIAGSLRIELENNNITAQEAERLGNLSRNSRVQINLSVHEQNVTTDYNSNATINSILALYQDNQDKKSVRDFLSNPRLEQFKRFLSECSRTSGWTNNQEEMSQALSNLINKMREDEGLKIKCLTIADTALGSCGDRVSIAYVQMILAANVTQKPVDQMDIKELFEYSRQESITKFLNDKAEERLREIRTRGGSSDEIETYLAYLQAAPTLGAHLPASRMLYMGISNVTEPDLVSAVDEFRQKSPIYRAAEHAYEDESLKQHPLIQEIITAKNNAEDLDYSHREGESYTEYDVRIKQLQKVVRSNIIDTVEEHFKQQQSSLESNEKERSDLAISYSREAEGEIQTRNINPTTSAQTASTPETTVENRNSAEQLVARSDRTIDLLRNTTNHLNSAKFLATTKKIS